MKGGEEAEEEEEKEEEKEVRTADEEECEADDEEKVEADDEVEESKLSVIIGGHALRRISINLYRHDTTEYEGGANSGDDVQCH